MRNKILTAAAAITLVGVTGAGIAVASSSSPSVVGVCANKATGGLRLLEAKNVAKSQYGKCRSTEVKVPLTTVVAKGPKGDKGDVGPAPAVIVYRRITGTETCTKGHRSTTTVVIYNCTNAPVPVPTPTVTPTPTPTPTVTPTVTPAN